MDKRSAGETNIAGFSRVMEQSAPFVQDMPDLDKPLWILVDKLGSNYKTSVIIKFILYSFWKYSWRYLHDHVFSPDNSHNHKLIKKCILIVFVKTFLEKDHIESSKKTVFGMFFLNLKEMYQEICNLNYLSNDFFQFSYLRWWNQSLSHQRRLKRLPYVAIEHCIVWIGLYVGIYITW